MGHIKLAEFSCGRGLKLIDENNVEPKTQNECKMIVLIYEKLWISRKTAVEFVRRLSWWAISIEHVAQLQCATYHTKWYWKSILSSDTQQQSNASKLISSFFHLHLCMVCDTQCNSFSNNKLKMLATQTKNYLSKAARMENFRYAPPVRMHCDALAHFLRRELCLLCVCVRVCSKFTSDL